MKVLVIGASLNPLRVSHRVIQHLEAQDYEVIAVGRKPGMIGAVEILTDLPKLSGIDTVTLYINAERQPGYYDQILSIAPNRVIFNPGTENHEFVEILRNHGITPEISCNLVLLKTGQF